MSAGRCWIFLISLASAVTRIIEVRADIDPRLVRSKYVCENDVMHLTCGPSSVLKIEAADFGESSGSICREGEPTNQLCKLMDKTDTVKTRCNDKTDCSIVAMRSIFGDPCQGMNIQTDELSSVYLNVIYACVKSVNSGKSTTCKTTPTRPSAVISTAEDNVINDTITTIPPLNLTAMANFTQPLTTKPNKNLASTIRSKEIGPQGEKEIPVFDPAKSVDLEAISGTTNVMSFSSVGFLTWICIAGLIAHWR